MAVEDQKLEKLVQRYASGSELRRWWPVVGGVSAQVIGLEIGLPDGTIQTVIMRRHGEADLAGNPNIAADEFRLLNLLHPYNLGTAKPLFLDTSCEIYPTPLLLLAYLDG
ncbi:MAG: phosphotransferase family protein, partial [Anaerolineae bacterium]|nr:phosphotransferase family protein [Anaerolineae bacterium]